MKTPEEYFQESVRLPEETREQGGMTPAERAFVEKYLGMGEGIGGVRRYDPTEKDSVPGFSAAPKTGGASGTPQALAAAAPVFDLDAKLRTLPELQLVSFKVDTQEFAVPIITIQEVIRAIAPTKLPKAPIYVEGVINLRGRVTPLIALRSMLGMGGQAADDRFIIVCSHQGLQVGMIVTAVVTMYRAQRADIEWGIEGNLGISANFLAGIMKKNDRLINIISVDRLVSRLLDK